VTSIVPFNFVGKPAHRSYRWATLSTSGNANWRSRTSLLRCCDYVETACLDLSHPSTILRRFPQPAYFFKYDATASFLLSQVSYLWISTLVGPSLTPGLLPGPSLQTDSRTWPLFSLLTPIYGLRHPSLLNIPVIGGISNQGCQMPLRILIRFTFCNLQGATFLKTFSLTITKITLSVSNESPWPL
jgi:hypothetical protein